MLADIETTLARNYFDAFNRAFINNPEYHKQVIEAVAHGATDAELDNLPMTEGDISFVLATQEIEEYLQLTGEPFEAEGYHFRLDLNGELEITLSTEFIPKTPPKTVWREAAEKYLAKHPERIENGMAFDVP